MGSSPPLPPEKPSSRNKHQQNVDNSLKAQMMVSFFFLVMPLHMQDFSSMTRDQTRGPALEDRVLTTGPPGKSLMVSTF